MDRVRSPKPMKIDIGKPGKILLFLTYSKDIYAPIKTPVIVNMNGKIYARGFPVTVTRCGPPKSLLTKVIEVNVL